MSCDVCPRAVCVEVVLPSDAICHGQLYKMMVRWRGGSG